MVVRATDLLQTTRERLSSLSPLTLVEQNSHGILHRYNDGRGVKVERTRPQEDTARPQRYPVALQSADDSLPGDQFFLFG